MLKDYVRENPDEDLTETPEAKEFNKLVTYTDLLRNTLEHISSYACFGIQEPDESFRGICEEGEGYFAAAIRIYLNYAFMIYDSATDKYREEEAAKALGLIGCLREDLKNHQDVQEELNALFGELFYTKEEWESPTLFREQKGFNPMDCKECERFRQLLCDNLWLHEEYERRFCPRRRPDDEE